MMRKIVVLIICLSTILCTFESCGKVKVNQKTVKTAKKVVTPTWQAIRKWFTGKSPTLPDEFKELLRKDIARRQNLAKDVMKFCNIESSPLSTKSEKIIFKGCGNNEVKAMISNMNVTKTIQIGNIFKTTFKELNYSAAWYNDIGNNLMEVTIPYYTRSGYAKSYVKIKFSVGNHSKVKEVISKLSREDDNPYAKLKQNLTFVKEEDIEIVNFIENSVIAENNLIDNDNEGFGISYNTIA